MSFIHSLLTAFQKLCLINENFIGALDKIEVTFDEQPLFLVMTTTQRPNSKG